MGKVDHCIVADCEDVGVYDKKRGKRYFVKGMCHKHYRKNMSLTHGGFWHGGKKFSSKDECRVYAVWATMKARCYNKNTPSYRFYGGKGISVSDEWKTFINFQADMQSTYRSGLTIERKNPRRDYCKENCVWATWQEQGKSRCNSRTFEHNGVSLGISEWSKKIGVKKSTLSMRIYKCKWDFNKAVTTPVGKRG